MTLPNPGEPNHGIRGTGDQLRGWSCSRHMFPGAIVSVPLPASESGFVTWVTQLL